ncbi:MAG: Acyl carrier protein [Chlamydiia bacterium]|nr:Acyl carrier protein [Chlamydiia bacterium]
MVFFWPFGQIEAMEWIRSQVVGVIAGEMQLHPQEILDHYDLVKDLGADSLNLFLIFYGIEQKLGLQMPLDRLRESVKVGDLVAECKALIPNVS